MSETKWSTRDNSARASDSRALQNLRRMNDASVVTEVKINAVRSELFTIVSLFAKRC